MINKKIVMQISLSIFLLGAVIALALFGKDWLFSMQYNEKGVSHLLVITIDKKQPKEYIGILDNHKIYIENLNIKETNFRNVKAENVSIKEAIDKKLVSIKEWKKYARKIKTTNNIETLRYDNYEIACSKDECIIRPI